MKNLILMIALICFNNHSNAQISSYPEGVYMDLQEVLDKAPSKTANAKLEHRTPGKIKMNGGNDYQINPLDKDVKRSFFLKDVFAYSEGTDLYINCSKYELQYWYSKVEGENENFFFFKAGIPMHPKKFGLENSDVNYMFGGFVGAFGAAKRALIRLPYVLDKPTKAPILVSQKNIRDYIGGSPRLVEAYDKETEKDAVEIISKYLLKWITEH
ncbi:hypothetical protein ES711_03870 [Gelidibacter salicanalis]|uniref:GLPGLI family protein n=1 Tax=Gelidibacter salicanalis TaxID=291193 RepID=A0A5C7AKZ4_9FLAO|nr:DUF6563 family protein [Gelidibacter salicanalis]TXE09081.1 hypothetical protein ES711_03870 [Gelidibacter salicanalis]